MYYRLHVIQITLPPLRERAEDIAALAESFLHKFNAENGMHLSAVSPDALHCLQSYPWPGNIRELENAVERSVVLADPDATEITVDLLPSVVRERCLV